MNNYRVERKDGKTDSVAADAFQINGQTLIFVTIRKGIVTPQNPKGQDTAQPFKIYNEWVCVTDVGNFQ